MCAGGDLLGYVRKRKRLDEITAKYIFKQVVEGLEYLHQHNVIHRDIKLDNILVHANGIVKVKNGNVNNSRLEILVYQNNWNNGMR